MSEQTACRKKTMEYMDSCPLFPVQGSTAQCVAAQIRQPHLLPGRCKRKTAAPTAPALPPKCVDAQTVEVVVQAEKPALYVWLELFQLDARYDDNFFHLRPGTAHTVTVTLPEDITLDDFRAALVVRSLVDTYQ